MLMYTSCGWFFDNISGIETVQVMMYASRAMQLCHEVQNWNLEPEFKNMLLNAPTNRRPYANGKEVYEAYVEPARVDLHRVGAHFALSSVFEESSEENHRHLLLFRDDRGFRARRGGRAGPDDQPHEDPLEHHARGVRGRFGRALPGRPSSVCLGAGPHARRAVQADSPGPREGLPQGRQQRGHAADERGLRRQELLADPPVQGPAAADPQRAARKHLGGDRELVPPHLRAQLRDHGR